MYRFIANQPKVSEISVTEGTPTADPGPVALHSLLASLLAVFLVYQIHLTMSVIE
jgi:hypothetical protein